MTYFYRKHEDGSIMDWSTESYTEDCLETEKDIIQAWDGAYYLEDEVPETLREGGLIIRKTA